MALRVRHCLSHGGPCGDADAAVAAAVRADSAASCQTASGCCCMDGTTLPLRSPDDGCCCCSQCACDQSVHTAAMRSSTLLHCRHHFLLARHSIQHETTHRQTLAKQVALAVALRQRLRLDATGALRAETRLCRSGALARACLDDSHCYCCCCCYWRATWLPTVVRLHLCDFADGGARCCRVETTPSMQRGAPRATSWRGVCRARGRTDGQTR